MLRLPCWSRNKENYLTMQLDESNSLTNHQKKGTRNCSKFYCKIRCTANEKKARIIEQNKRERKKERNHWRVFLEWSEQENETRANLKSGKKKMKCFNFRIFIDHRLMPHSLTPSEQHRWAIFVFQIFIRDSFVLAGKICVDFTM